jgi:hypothetical protein
MNIFKLSAAGRCLPSLLLYVVCALLAPAQAEWKLYGDNGKAEFFYDPSSIVVQGDTVAVWEMLNYSFPLNRVLSNRSHKQFDCSKGTFRILDGEFFAGPLLSGDIISQSQAAEVEWRTPAPGTRNLELMVLVCPVKS